MSSKSKSTATKEEAKPALVPKLRFPEFRAAGGWEEKNIGQVCKSFSGGTPNTAQKEFYGGSIPFIRSAEIDRTETELFLTEEGLKNSAAKLVATGDVLVALYGANSGDVALARIDGAINQAILCLKSDRSNAFIYQFLSLRKTWIIKTYLQGGQGNLSGEIVKSISLGFPTPPEQQKIAECLSSVDELMAAQARKVHALKSHKKGLMQQLFPREGETQPSLRFPEFQNAGEWSEGCIADIATVLQGYGFPERHQGQTSGDYPFYKVSDISRSLAAGKLFIQESANYINENFLKELRAKPIPEGTTIFAKIGEAIRSNKRAITTVPCLIDNNAAGVKRIKGKATDLFIYLLMEQISLIDHAGGVVPAVNKSAIEEIAVKFPKPDEQERIATCLSSLDALITAETQKLEALKTHKKGLMQQLFPSPEEPEQ